MTGREIAQERAIEWRSIQAQINECFSREIQSGDRVIVGLKEDK